MKRGRCFQIGVLTGLMLVIELCSAVVAADQKITPGASIEPCSVVARKNLPKGYGILGNVFWGNGILVNWMNVGPDDGIPLEKLPGDRMTIVLKGAVRLLVDGERLLLRERECIWLKDETLYALAPVGSASEIIEVYWPSSGIDHSHNDIMFPIGSATYRETLKQWKLPSMMRPWESVPEKTTGGAKPSTPSTIHGRPVAIDALQFCRPAENAWTRIIQGRRGQACFIKMAPGEEITGTVTTEEQFHIVLAGTVEKSVADSTLSLNENDVIYLPKGTYHDSKAGEKGCEILALLSNVNPEMTRALEERNERFHSIIPRGAEPILCYDGITEKPALTFTEGPSWINGRLYFTNTYLLSRRPGTNDEAGLNVLDDKGSVSILNLDLQPVGTYPLPNGNIAATEIIGHAIVEITTGGRYVRTIADSYDGQAFGMPNDLVVDGKGGIYFTDPRGGIFGEVPGKAVYYIRPSGEVIRLTDWDEYAFPNGCALSPDGSLFYLNTTHGGTGEGERSEVWVYNVNEDGTLSNKRKFADIIFGRTADGLAIDRMGNLYVATGTGGIQIFDGAGNFIGHLHFPKQVQNCVFGGEDLSTLYATCRSQIYSIRTKMQGIQCPVR